jgi:DNA end-binding protein Ku
VGRAAVGKFVLRNKEYVAVIRPLKDVLCLETLHFADEVIQPKDVRDLAPRLAVSSLELKTAVQLVNTLSSEFEPESLHDDYRAALQDLIRKKAAGEPVAATLPEAGESPEVIDLMAALEKSLREVKKHKPSRAA